MVRQKLAVVLIDYQQRFLDELYTGTRNRLISASLDLIEAAGRTGTPIAYLSYPESQYGPINGQIIGAIRKAPKKQGFEKKSRSGFEEQTKPNLEQVLRNGWHTNTLVLAGIHANQCVVSTAIDAKSLGFRLITAKHLIAEGNKHRQLDFIDSYEFGKNAYECALGILGRIGTVYDDHNELIGKLFGHESMYQAAARHTSDVVHGVEEAVHGIENAAHYVGDTVMNAAGQARKIVSLQARLF